MAGWCGVRRRRFRGRTRTRDEGGEYGVVVWMGKDGGRVRVRKCLFLIGGGEGGGACVGGFMGNPSGWTPPP